MPWPDFQARFVFVSLYRHIADPHIANLFEDRERDFGQKSPGEKLSGYDILEACPGWGGGRKGLSCVFCVISTINGVAR